MDVISSVTISSTRSSQSEGSFAFSAASKETFVAKDSVTSPIDLECRIQSERIATILDEAIYKSKLACCISDLYKERKFLESVLTSTQMEDVDFIFDQYDTSSVSTSDSLTLVTASAIQHFKLGARTSKLCPELTHLFYILSGSPELKVKVDELMEHSDMMPTPNTQSPTLILFVTLMESLKEKMLQQMGFSAAEQLMEQNHLRRLQKYNENIKEKILEVRHTLKSEYHQFNITMKEKQDNIKKLQDELDVLTNQCKMLIKKKVLDSERQMVMARRAHEIKFEMLKEEDVESKENYENVLRLHLDSEKALRAKRFKIETQLLSWLQKYDTEIGDKQTELDEVTENYERELALIKDLEEKLETQRMEYEPLMEEREKEYHEEMMAKMNKFLMEHSARVLQSAWRSVLHNRAEKKRLKKLAARAERAAQAAAKK